MQLLEPETRSALLKSFLMAAFWLSTILFSTSVHAANLPNLQTMITNFATAVPNMMRLVTAASYVMGMMMVAASVVGMKHFGELRMAMNKEHGIWGPIIELLVGCSLLYLPTTIRAGLNTFWVTTNPYAYETAADSSSSFMQTAFTIVQLIGVIAFIRGLMMLNQLGSQQASPQLLGKAAAHLTGGILCINIYNTIKMLEATIGMAT